MRLLLISTFLCFLYSCIPPSEHNDQEINIDLSTDIHKKIINAKDNRDVTTLLTYLSSTNVSERYLATESCSSIQDDSLSAKLLLLLNQDASQDVRYMSAYALGQLGDGKYLSDLVMAFTSQDTANYNTPLRGAILEAIGKCGDQATLDLIASVSTYRNTDHHLLLGQARAIYRYGRRNIYSERATQVMIDRLLDTNIPQETRMIAAQYLNRNPNLDIEISLPRMIQLLPNESNVDVRMALAGALTRTGNESALEVILTMLTNDEDYRVRSNILRQLGSYNYTQYSTIVTNLLDDKNPHIFDLASQLLLNTSPRQQAGFYLAKAKVDSVGIRKPKLLAIALNSLPVRYINTRRNISNLLKQGLTDSKGEVTQVEYIKALSLDPINIQAIIENGLASDSHFIKTASINAIADLLTNAKTKSIYRRPSAFAAFREAIVGPLTDILKDGDSGSIAAISTLIRHAECGFRDVVDLNLTIRSALRGLQMPKDYEARKEGFETLGYLEDTVYHIDPPTMNQPIDWTLLEGLNDSSRTYIITTRGRIEVKLYKNHAPASVANFVALAQSNFYDGKAIHRVVPNFVIQGGCPRGDGYGSLDYTIRSELGPKYYDAEGYLGMASAGRDTEGTQWFITHSPTPHLDGNYTIFGKVTSGMDVVHSIEVGDKIQDVRILKY